LEITAQKVFTDSNGREIGYSFLVSPIKNNIAELAIDRGGLNKYRTEIDSKNRIVFENLGFKEASDPIYGKYMAEIPDANLFEYLRSQYNKSAAPDMQINMGIYQSHVVSAHQSEILRFWVNHGTMAIGKPELGSVLGKSPNEIAEMLMKHGKELNSIYRHDLEHFASMLLVPNEVVKFNRHVSVFWKNVLGHFYESARKGEYELNGERHRELLDVIYVFVRRFHSLTHVLGMLSRANGSIDINNDVITNFGDVARKETPSVHWTGLGYRPKWVGKAQLPFESRLLELGLKESRNVEEPVTMADAYRAVTNEALEQMQLFIENQTDPSLKILYRQMVNEAGLDKLSPLSENELTRLQSLTLRRHKQMGKNLEESTNK
jgi:hypothetical protein